jgi:hypothetical protein
MTQFSQVAVLGPMIYQLVYLAVSPVTSSRNSDPEIHRALPRSMRVVYSVVGVSLLELISGEAPGTVTQSESS